MRGLHEVACEIKLTANPYQADVVKRADGCTTGAGWPSEEQLVNHLCQAIGADLISVAGHSLWAAPNTYRGSMFSYSLVYGEQWYSQDHARETLLCPRPGLLNASGLCRRHS